MSYVRAHLVPNLRPGDFVIWDRLGKAGKCLNPKKQHYNPEAKELVEEKGARIMFLPPKGKLWVPSKFAIPKTILTLPPFPSFNPIELSFSKFKTHIRNSYTGSPAAREGRHRRDMELIQAIVDGCAKVTPSDVAGYFRERAGMRAFKEMYPDVALD
jgi:transposase